MPLDRRAKEMARRQVSDPFEGMEATIGVRNSLEKAALAASSFHAR